MLRMLREQNLLFSSELEAGKMQPQKLLEALFWLLRLLEGSKKQRKKYEARLNLDSSVLWANKSLVV